MGTSDSIEPRIYGAFEAKTRFSELLERAAAGEEITITRHGAPVARLVPIHTQPTESSRAAAIAGMRQIAMRNQLCGLSIRELREQGRR